MNDEFRKLKEEGLGYLKNKKHTKAADIIEKALSIKYDEELEKALAATSYKSIWDFYTGKNFERMEWAANLSINLHSKKEYYNPLKLAKSYNGLSIALHTLGKGTIEHNLKAKKIYDEILLDESLTKTKKKQLLSSKVYNDFGIIINLGHAGNLKKASLLCEEDINLCKEYEMDLQLGITFKIYGELLYYFGKVEDSLSKYKEALKILLNKKDTINYQHHIGDIYLKVASNFLKDGNYEKALLCTNKAYPYLHTVGRNTFRFYYIRGVIAEDYTQLDKAAEYYNKAFDMLLSLRVDLITESNVDGFLKKQEREKTFKNAIRIQHKINNIPKFLEFLEKYRGREFIEKILQGKRTALLGIPVGLIKDRNRIENEIKVTLANNKLTQEEKAEKITKLENNLYFTEEKIAGSKSVYKLYGESINNELNRILKTVQRILKPKQVIISYFYYTDGVYLSLIKTNKVITRFVEVTKKNLEEILSNYLNYLRNFSHNNTSTKKIIVYYENYISNYLLKPIEKDISDDNEIVIVPFETLHIFPLHILFLNKFPNIKLSFMPSIASILYINPERKKLADICIFADPRNNLPSVINEVELIPKFFNKSNILYKNNASKKAFLENWDKYEALHYSGHFRYKNDKPLYSYIECNGNEKIKLSKIYQLSSNKISFLSLGGCSSGLSRVYKGEELTGTIRGFFYAGIKSILATLWDVEDKSASDFLILFYKKLQEFKGNKKMAFSYTYREMKKKYSHPFFYAPFILYEGLYK